MITVTVKRGAGDRPGQPITDPLIAGSEAAARARANAELDVTEKINQGSGHDMSR